LFQTSSTPNNLATVQRTPLNLNQ